MKKSRLEHALSLTFAGLLTLPLASAADVAGKPTNRIERELIHDTS